MKWYFASRQKHKHHISKILDFLEAKGHTVRYDWTKLGQLQPYNKHALESETVAKEITEAVNECDIFVLISDEGGTDMFTELGIAISRYLERNKPRIYITGSMNNRSLMHFHPSIIRLDSINSVFEIECPEMELAEISTVLQKIEEK
ncbi:hypothetical protein JW868_01505 [Candidatus Woesearchaeota archaeon]|nr:hypothetical protein [Candidatus Woesearchaeota archaeon]